MTILTLPPSTSDKGEPESYKVTKVTTIRYETDTPEALIFLPSPVEIREVITFSAWKITERSYEVSESEEPTRSYFLTEDWEGVEVYTPDQAPKLPLVWCKGDDPRPINVSALVVQEEDLGKCLELRIYEPVHGTTYGIRVFPTVETRWEVYKPYANQEVWIEVPMKIQTPLDIHTTGATGEWDTIGLQVKDGVSKFALFQMNWEVNSDGEIQLWCEMPYGQASRVGEPYILHSGVMDVVLRYKWSSDDSGSFDLYIDGRRVFTGTGRTGHPQNGFGNVSLTLYGNIFDGNARAWFGEFKSGVSLLI